MRGYMRQYQQFLNFIIRIRSGVNTIIISTEYVVMSRKHYKELIKKNQIKRGYEETMDDFYGRS